MAVRLFCGRRISPIQDGKLRESAFQEAHQNMNQYMRQKRLKKTSAVFFFEFGGI
jgi:hypothetical protein